MSSELDECANAPSLPWEPKSPDTAVDFRRTHPSDDGGYVTQDQGCNTRSTQMKTVLMRLLVSRKLTTRSLTMDSRRGQANGFVVPRIREETLMGMGQTSANLKSKGTFSKVKDLLKIWQRCETTPTATALRTLGRKPSETADLSSFSSFSFASTSGSTQLRCSLLRCSHRDGW